jgi:polysaccharide biosynthesis/export protein
MKENQRALRPNALSRTMLALVALALVGCATAPQVRLPSPQSVEGSPAVEQINRGLAAAAMQTPDSAADYLLGPEDVVQITLFNIPEGEAGVTPRLTEVRVSQEGKVTLPLLDDITVAGMTTAALEQMLKERYDRFIRAPQVGVQVKEFRSHQVSVIGAVEKPGPFQLTGPRTLADLLSMAGGINGKAGSQVHIYRQGPQGRQTHVVDLLALASNPALVNIPVQAGDVINVPQAGMFFVDGAVKKPGSFALSRPYTLSQALAMAGGVDDELANYSEVAILRRRNGVESEKITVSLKEIQATKVPDPLIEAEDVIVVPVSTGKWIVWRFFGRIGLGSVGSYPL